MKLILILLLQISYGYAREIQIAVIDTGYSEAFAEKKGLNKPKICKKGSYDFSSKVEGVTGDDITHGTYIASIIAEGLKNVDYCLIIYRVDEAGSINGRYIIQALLKAVKTRVGAVGIMSTGRRPLKYENLALGLLERLNTPVFVSAGNDNENLGKVCNTYPACYTHKNVHVVGATAENGTMCPSTNYGDKVTDWARGYCNIDGKIDCATSFAAPRAIVEYVLGLRKSASTVDINSDLVRKTSEALYKQIGLEKEVDMELKTIENGLTKGQKEYGGWIYEFIRIMFEQRVQFKFSF